MLAELLHAFHVPQAHSIPILCRLVSQTAKTALKINMPSAIPVHVHLAQLVVHRIVIRHLQIVSHARMDTLLIQRNTLIRVFYVETPFLGAQAAVQQLRAIDVNSVII